MAPHRRRPSDGGCAELAQTRVAYSYRRLHVLLCREGWPMNHKSGPTVLSRRRLDTTAPATEAAPRAMRLLPGAARHHSRPARGWAHVSRAQYRGSLHARVCRVSTRCLRADDVVAALSRLRDERGGRPTTAASSRPWHSTTGVIGTRSGWTSVAPVSRPTTPPSRASTTAFDACFTQHDSIDLTDAQRSIEP